MSPGKIAKRLGQVGSGGVGSKGRESSGFVLFIGGTKEVVDLDRCTLRRQCSCCSNCYKTPDILIAQVFMTHSCSVEPKLSDILVLWMTVGVHVRSGG